MQFRAYQPVEVEFGPGKLDRLETLASPLREQPSSSPSH
jgi:hypothetical protein